MATERDITASEVDIIIPCYNMSKYLPQAIESALAQNYDPLRIVVVDDGSTEDIRSIVRSYGGRIDYVRQENKGLPAARNTGIKFTHGEFLCFLDADDIILPSKTAHQVAFLREKPQVDVIHGRSLFFNNEDVYSPYAEMRPYKSWSDYLDPLSIFCPFSVHSALIRRKMVNRIGLFSERMITGCEDWAYWLDCLLGGAIFEYMPVVTALYRKHIHSMSTDAKRLVANERDWLPSAKRKIEEAGLLNGKRAMVVSCGFRLIASRLFKLGIKAEYDRFMRVSLTLSSINKNWNMAGYYHKFEKNITPSISYLLLSKDLCDLELPQLACFCLLDFGDIRLIRWQAIKHGLLNEFEEVVRVIEKSISKDCNTVKPQEQQDKNVTNPITDLGTELFKNLEQHVPKHASHESYMIHQMGLLDQESGKLDEAAVKYRLAIHLNPFYWKFYEDLIRVLSVSGRRVEAEHVARSMLDLCKKSPFGNYFIGRELLRSFHLVAGMRQMKRSIVADPISWIRYMMTDFDWLLLRYLGQKALIFRTQAVNTILQNRWFQQLLKILRKILKPVQ